MFTLDPDGTILSWNKGVEKLLGYGESEWIGQSGELIFTPEDRTSAAFREEISRALAAGQAAGARWYLTKGGRWIFLDGILTAVRDEAGTILCLTQLLRDATSWQTLKQRFDVVEERFRLARIGSGLGIWDWDILADRIEASETYFELFGTPHQAGPLTFEQWLASVHPGDRERLIVSTREALQTGRFLNEFRVIRPNGGVRWVHATGIVQYRGEQPVRMVRVLRDITAEKANEQALRESEARNAAILRASLDAVLLMDHHGIIREFNPAAEEMFGIPQHEAVGKPLADVIIPPRLRQQHREGLARYLSSGEAVVLGRHIEIESMRPDGSEFPVEVAITQAIWGRSTSLSERNMAGALDNGTILQL